MKYLFFTGCVTPVRCLEYEATTRYTFSKIGIELIDEPQFTCCASPQLLSYSLDRGVLVALRNLAIAEQHALPILTPCSGCVHTLRLAHAYATAEPRRLRSFNNRLQEIGVRYSGRTQVLHILDILQQSTTLIEQRLQRRWRPSRIAFFPGCHIRRPSSYSYYETEKVLQLLSVLGFKPIALDERWLCCGGGLRGIRDELGLKMAREVLAYATQKKATAIVVACPFCFIQLDRSQIELNYRPEIPIIHITELTAYSLGADPYEMGVDRHAIDITSFVEERLQ